MKKTVLFLIVALMLVFSSCTSFQVSGVQVAANLPEAETLGTFETTVKVMEFLGAPAGANILNVSADAMDQEIIDAIQAEIQALGGDAAINVDIVYQASLGNMIVGGLTFNILAPGTAIVTGTVVKY